MRILQFSLENKALAWNLEQISLNKLNLLVGASGVGKTLILKALMLLKEIAHGSSVNGIKWCVEFKTLTSQKTYIWQGEFDNEDNLSLDEDWQYYFLLHSIYKNIEKYDNLYA